MLVDINLLPQKERKSVAFLVLLTIIAALFVLATVFYINQITATKQTITATENQIEQTQKLESVLQKQVGNSAAGNSVNQLKSAITWAMQNRIETIPVMLHLTALLPERGFIQSFSYLDAGTVTLTVQFDTETEAAAYLNSLNHSDWITSASLSSLNTANNSGSASGSQTNSMNAASTTQSQTNSLNAASNTESTSAATADTNTTSNAGVTNTGTNITASQSNVLPRYSGQFTIQFNQKAVEKASELSKKDSGDEEGVASS